jgi:hypothetical protein
VTIASRIAKLETLTSGRTAGDEARLAGDAMRAEIHAMLADPAAVAEAVAWDNAHLAELDLAGLDEEARAVALEKSLAA